ncbi:MAG: DUF4058 family protein [Isosphaerales bacterium]
MRSPFPGMDPYLEDPEVWRGAHHRFISAADEQLQPQLNNRGYYVDVESRIWLERPERLVYPDVALLRTQQRLPTTSESPGGTLVADEPVRLHSLENEVREDYLQIYEIDTRNLITGIEFVSPNNKADHKARGLYVRKRRRLWAAEVNIVEVDLLRGGKPLVRLPKAVLQGFQPGGYVINVLRVDSLDYEFYPVDLKSRLPRVGIPLKPGEPDVVLDLQAAIARIYEAGAYPLRIDYNRQPIPPLDEESACWSEKLLVDAGLREPPTPAGPSNGPSNPSE